MAVRPNPCCILRTPLKSLLNSKSPIDAPDNAAVPERGRCGGYAGSAAVDEEWEVWEEQPEAMEVDKHPNARRSGRLGAPQEEFVVAQVLEDRVHDGQQQWLIRWQGCGRPPDEI